jgi:hypothetical protein
MTMIKPPVLVMTGIREYDGDDDNVAADSDYDDVEWVLAEGTIDGFSTAIKCSGFSAAEDCYNQIMVHLPSCTQKQ